MKVFWGVVVLLLVTACIQFVPEEKNETTYTSEVVQTNNTIANATAVPKNMTIKPKVVIDVSENLTNQTEISIVENQTNDSNPITGSIIENVSVDLTIGAAHKMFPQLEEAVKNAPCYNLTWNGIEEQQMLRPIEIKKEMRFEYVGGRLFKGWILLIMKLNSAMIDSQTVQVIVEEMQVTCLDTDNFTINWDEKLKRFNN
jgi:hypothetical protein